MTDSTPVQSPGEGTFAKVLSFRDLVVYGLVYLAPIAPWATFAYVHSLSGGRAVLAYIAGIVCMFFTASSYKQMVEAVPGPGSVYAYARAAMGTGAGFIAGWMVLLDYLLIPALMYVLAAVALNTLVPEIPRWIWIFGFAGFGLGVNWFGIGMSARFNKFFLLLQLAAVAVFIVWALWARGFEASFPSEAIWNGTGDAAGLFAATAICVLAFLGFDAISTLSEEVRPDQRHLIGTSIIMVLLIMGAITVVQSWIMSGLAVGFKFNDLAAGAYEMAAAKLSPVLSSGMAWVVAAVAGIALTPPMLTAVSRVLQAMSAGGQLPAVLSHLHPKFGVPHKALLFATTISVSIALVFMEVPDTLTGIVNFGALAAYGAVHLSVLALLVVKNGSRRWLVHILFPLLGLGVIVAVATQFSRMALILGGVWLVAGIIYYAMLKIFRRNASDMRVDIA